MSAPWRLIPWLDHQSSRSLARRFRARRLACLESVVPLAPGTRVLDVGGMPGSSLLARRTDLRVTYLNLYPGARIARSLRPEHAYLHADAREIPLCDGAFDVVFSNSLLEHLEPDDQRAVASEIRRVGRAHFVQVPYRYFPWEPHYNFPFVQFAPRPVRRFLWRRWWLSYGRRNHQPYEEIYLSTRAEIQSLFPTSSIVEERAGPLVKALYAWASDTGRSRAAG